VYWRINYRWCGIGDTFDAPATWATKQTIMALAAGDGFKHKYHELVTDADIALPTTFSTSSILLAEVIREGATEANDNFHDAKTEAVPPYTAKCNLAILGIDAHILVDSDGSENDLTY